MSYATESHPPVYPKELLERQFTEDDGSRQLGVTQLRKTVIEC
jgi:hypothetical protein